MNMSVSKQSFCFSGLGGALEGHPFSCPARVAKGQRLPPARTSAPYALFSSLLWKHLQNSHWDRKHLDSPVRWELNNAYSLQPKFFSSRLCLQPHVSLMAYVLKCIILYSSNLFSCYLFENHPIFSLRADLIPLPGHVNNAAAQHVFYGSTARESGFWDVLPGSCALPQFLLAFSYRLLPLWESVSHLLQVRPHIVSHILSHTCLVCLGEIFCHCQCLFLF